MGDDKSKEKKVPAEMILEVKPEQKSKKGSEQPPDIFKPYGEEMKLEEKLGRRPEEQQPQERVEKPRSRQIYGGPSDKNFVPEEYVLKNKDSKDPRNLTAKEVKRARDAALKKIEEKRKKRFEERQKMLQKWIGNTSKNEEERKKKLEELKKAEKKIDEKLKRKAALEKGLARRRAMQLAKKFQMDAKQGTSLAITAMFIIVLGIALVNDLSDIVLEIVGFIVSLTGVGLAVLGVFESVIKVVDVATTAILVLFTIYVGGETRANSKQKFMMLARILIAVGIEAIPFLDLITSWTITTLWNWYDVRRRAHEAEAIE